MKRIGLHFEDWPETDRVAWTSMFQKGHPLDGAGPLSHYRDASILHLRNAYSYWLAWVMREDPALLLDPPLARVTAERMVAWRAAMAHLAPYSVCGQLQALGRVLHSLDRDRPDRRERAVINHATAHAERAGSDRKRGRIVDTSVLVDAGLLQFSQHIAATARDPKAALHCRDGAMIMLLALMPMRRRPFVGLELGRSLRRTATGWHVTLSEADLKCGESWESAVPQVLVEPLSAYVDLVRPCLAGAAGTEHKHLWLTRDGRPMDAPYIGVRMKELTVRLIGRDISCHLFRDCATTTLAVTSPDMARLTKGLLGHTSDRTATRYYNQATSLEAGRLLGTRIEAIKRKR